MSNQRETLFDVTGMSCPSCVRHIHAALGALEGVGAVQVRLHEGTVLVKHDDRTAIEEMARALNEAGYEVALAA
jgi:copper chaperone